MIVIETSLKNMFKWERSVENNTSILVTEETDANSEILLFSLRSMKWVDIHAGRAME